MSPVEPAIMGPELKADADRLSQPMVEQPAVRVDDLNEKRAQTCVPASTGIAPTRGSKLANYQRHVPASPCEVRVRDGSHRHVEVQPRGGRSEVFFRGSLQM